MMERRDISSAMEVREFYISSEKEGNDDFFEIAMQGQWDKVVEAYKNPMIQEAKITKSEDTALHIAVTDGKFDIVRKLVDAMGDNASNILHIKNDKGNTALHLAAARGNVEMCYCMALKDSNLVAARNNESETPLFLAALHGKKAAFLCLHSFNKGGDSSLCRKSNGDNILHSAISGEYFRLVSQIIHDYPALINSVNENGETPLHILASKPNAFKSGSRFGLFDRIIYHCIPVDLFKKDKEDQKDWSIINNSGMRSHPNYPENYETCIKIFKLLKTTIRVLISAQKQGEGNDDEENAAQGGDTNRIPPNYATFVRFFKLMLKVLLVVLGLGIWRINHIAEKKETHKLANRIMDELVERTSIYKNENTGRNPQNSRSKKYEDAFSVDAISPPDSNSGVISQIPNPMDSTSSTSNHSKDDNGRDQRPTEKMKKPTLLAAKLGLTEMVDRFLESCPAAVQELNTSQKNLVLLTFDEKKTQLSERKETPILIAAKMGVAEMVEKILNKFPVAIQDLDSYNKNVVLLAVENRQTRIYKLLLKRKMLGESVFRQIDNEGNSALHLAATFGEYRPWLIPGGALQMQWEIKWYEFVKKSMPRHFFVRRNNKGKTPKEIFTETHQELVKEGREWLTKTSESCSVIAALIATVAFATSTTVPGGVDESSGRPILENNAVFDLFALSSLVALCFSVTALVFFLSILTSRFQEKDFAMTLPRKLLLGLTSLFTSIAAMLVSFCSGHSFVIKDRMRSAAYPIYGATCLPMTFFALAQLSLYIDLMWAIFKKVPQRSYKVIPH